MASHTSQRLSIRLSETYCPDSTDKDFDLDFDADIDSEFNLDVDDKNIDEEILESNQCNDSNEVPLLIEGNNDDDDNQYILPNIFMNCLVNSNHQ